MPNDKYRKKFKCFVPVSRVARGQGMLWNGKWYGIKGVVWNMEDAQNGMEWKI